MNKTKKYRYEKDGLGNVAIPKQKYWGSTTQRSLHYFSISSEKIPIEFIHIYALFKKCAARANYKLKRLDKKSLDMISSVCNDIIDNKYNNEFPLHIWQTGSGTQTNMNVNEVIANICNQKVTGQLGTKTPIHPNNHVNMSQSTNDSFITALHMFVAIIVHTKLIPHLKYMIHGFKIKQQELKDVIKIGRTHLQDALPLTFGQEFSGYISLLEDSLHEINTSLQHIYKLAAGGTAVGTGVNAPKHFDTFVVREISTETKLPFSVAKNKFAELSSHNAVLKMSDSFKVLATNIIKIANDIRLASSGPTTGFGEIILPQNEPGSSIMPGKVNPTQCEAASMGCIQVIANNTAITLSNTQGQFELNVYNPSILYNITQSMTILSDICLHFTKFCILGLKVNKEKIKKNVDNSLSLATALNPYIGYDKTTHLVHYAHDHHITLQQANDKLKYLPEDKFKTYVDPKKMI